MQKVNHHYLPVSIQRRFTFNERKNNVFYCGRAAPTVPYGGVSPRNVERTFMTPYLYQVLIDGKGSDYLEDQFYSPLDANLHDYLTKIIEGIDKQRPCLFVGAALSELRKAMVEMVCRTEQFTQAYDPIQIASDIMEKSISAAEAMQISDADLSFAKKLIARRLEMKKMGRDLINRARVSEKPKVFGVLEEYTIRYAVCSGRSSFVLSTAVSFSPNSNHKVGLENKDCIVWMPISPNVCLVMVRDPTNRLPLVVQLNNEEVKYHNSMMAKFSVTLVSHSRPLLEAVIRRERQRLNGLNSEISAPNIMMYNNAKI